MKTIIKEYSQERDDRVVTLEFDDGTFLSYAEDSWDGYAYDLVWTSDSLGYVVGGCCESDLGKMTPVVKEPREESGQIVTIGYIVEKYSEPIRFRQVGDCDYE